jgi:hypothetical protein
VGSFVRINADHDAPPDVVRCNHKQIVADKFRLQTVLAGADVGNAKPEGSRARSASTGSGFAH